MAKDDRLYRVTIGDRPAYFGDIGQLLQVDGVLFGGMKQQFLFLMPGIYLDSIPVDQIFHPTLEEWSEIVANSDDAGYRLELQKKWVRKAQYIISGVVQQRVWAAWDFKCGFCGRKMGAVQLTVDHFMPIELGGANDESNYISACRKCNKDKGNMPPEEWCRQRNLNHNRVLQSILEKRRLIR